MDSLYTTQTPDNLIGGSSVQLLTKGGVQAVSQALTRGAVLGKIKVAAGTAVTPAGNTGKGLISGFALAAGGPAKIGNYSVVCAIIASGGGTFNVSDPNGQLVGIIKVGATFVGDGITFTIADGDPDFALGDYFTLPVVAGLGYYKLIDKAAVDGSNKFDGVLLRDCTTVGSTDKITVAVGGSFMSQALTFASGTVLADVVDDMRALGCYVDVTDSDNNRIAE